MWVSLEVESCRLSGPLDHPREARRRERRAALRREHEGRLGLLLALEPPQGA